MRFLTLLLLAIGAASAPPAGFAIRNLTALEFEPAKLLGDGFISRVDSARLTLACLSCTGSPAIDVLIGRQNDGTEERVRTGKTTMARLDSMCRSRDRSCRIEGLTVPPAVGWISSYRIGAQSANTVIVLRGGDLLTIRSLASDSAVARRNADRLVTALVPKIVGK